MPIEPQDPPAARKADTWHYWRGTPELFAHIVRTAERAMPTATARATEIDVCVGDDHEIFDSPTAFTKLVTVDALRHFDSISATVSAGNETSKIILRWVRPWWALGRGDDADVILEVTGEAHDIEPRYTLIRHAILRGGTDGTVRQAAITALLAGACSLVPGAMVLSVGYLSNLDSSSTLVIAALTSLITGGAGILWGTWAYPSIEVAPIGQTNLRRLLRDGVRLFLQ